nr:hypothetical protein [Hyphomicrobium sp.]
MTNDQDAFAALEMFDAGPEPASAPNSPLEDLQALIARAGALGRVHRVQGYVSRMIPGCVTVAGLSGFVSIGDLVSVETDHREYLGEVASIDAETINVTMLDASAPVRLRARVSMQNGPIRIAPHLSWQGRVINSLGQPIDDGNPLTPGPDALPLNRSSPAPLSRQPLSQPLTTGVKAVDLFTPLCAG